MMGRRYFKDFEFVEVPKKNGKGMRQEMVYIGDLYTADISLQEQKKNNLIFIGASVACTILHVAGAFVPVPSNSHPWIGMPAALGLVPIFIMLFGALNGLTVKGPMERSKYRGTAQYRKAGSAVTCVLLAYCAAALLVSFIRNGFGDNMAGELFVEFGYVIDFFLSLWIYRTERKIEYRIQPGKHSRLSKDIAKRSKLTEKEGALREDQKSE